VIDAALSYAARGWPVLPCRGKEPLTPHGVRDATPEVDRIRAWWTRWPDANVAIACGAPGPLVLDIDDFDAGRAVLDRLTVLDLDPPSVATTRGWHLYFVGDERPGRRFAWGELRGRGSYVVAPPSIHPTSGREYVWTVEPNGALPVLPHKPTCKPTPAPHVPMSVEELITAVRGVPDGQLGGPGRKRTLLRLVGHWLALGEHPYVVREMAHAVNARNRPPLPAHDVDRVVDWVSGQELHNHAHDRRPRRQEGR
jgi:hypothetical protein